MQNIKTLTTLSINFTMITDSFLYDVSCNLVELKYLDISNCSGISDEGLSYIFNLPKLEVY